MIKERESEFCEKGLMWEVTKGKGIFSGNRIEIRRDHMQAIVEMKVVSL